MRRADGTAFSLKCSTTSAAGFRMNVLALEFSSEHRSVAVALADQRGSMQILAEVAEQAPRSRGPLELVGAALEASGMERETVHRIAVGLGPGSYAGIRSALALAQGWRLGRSVEIVGVSSAFALALRAQSVGMTGRVNVLIDAQRGDVYHAAFEIGAGLPETQVPLRLVLAPQLAELWQAAGCWIGPEVRRWVPSGVPLHPAAGGIARLSLRPAHPGPAASLEPIYLRETAFVKAPPPRPTD
jgi:tRNA threonylcarbamoyl adenosine modification protein YeaZ